MSVYDYPSRTVETTFFKRERVEHIFEPFRVYFKVPTDCKTGSYNAKPHTQK